MLSVGIVILTNHICFSADNPPNTSFPVKPNPELLLLLRLLPSPPLP